MLGSAISIFKTKRLRSIEKMSIRFGLQMNLGIDVYIFAFHSAIKALLKDSHLDVYVFHQYLKKIN